MDVALTSVGAAVVGAAMGVAAVSGPWSMSDGSHVDDAYGAGDVGWEPIFRRFLYDKFSIIVCFLAIVLFLYGVPT